jgi:hypothetical protein
MLNAAFLWPEHLKIYKIYQGNIARLERGRTQATIRTLQRVAAPTGHRLIVDFRSVSEERRWRGNGRRRMPRQDP